MQFYGGRCFPDDARIGGFLYERNNIYQDVHVFGHDIRQLFG
jgi:hypothetical protein